MTQQKLEYDSALKVMSKFKKELEVMRKMAQPEDTIPAVAFFQFFDVLLPAFDAVAEKITELKEKEHVSK